MPYYRQRYRRRRYPRRRRYRRRRSNYGKYGSYALKALSTALAVKRMINPEYKHRTNVFAGTSINYNGTYNVLNLIPQGDTDLTRDGDSVKLVNLTLRGNVNNTVNSMFRLLIVWDKQNKTTQISDILDSVGSASVVNANKQYDKRFETKIFLDKRVPLSSSGANNKTFDQTININKHTQFEGGTTTISSGKLIAIFISDRVPASNEVQINFVTRLTYLDN